jgi:putative transposase
MPWVQVWLHFVWSTKDRYPYLTDEIRSKVFDHIRQNARKKGIHIDFINGSVEHVHCLISLGTDQTLSWLMQSIKGESSFWINQNKLIKTKFAWQDEYFVAAGNESTLPRSEDILPTRKSITRPLASMRSLRIFLFGLASASSKILRISFR